MNETTRLTSSRKEFPNTIELTKYSPLYSLDSTDNSNKHEAVEEAGGILLNIIFLIIIIVEFSDKNVINGHNLKKISVIFLVALSLLVMISLFMPKSNIIGDNIYL